MAGEDRVALVVALTADLLVAAVEEVVAARAGDRFVAPGHGRRAAGVREAPWLVGREADAELRLAADRRLGQRRVADEGQEGVGEGGAVPEVGRRAGILNRLVRRRGTGAAGDQRVLDPLV